MLKVYADTKDTQSRGIWRVIEALKRYAPPDIVFVSTPEEADMLVFHAIGRRERLERYVARYKKPYALIQYVLKSSLSPDPEAWLSLWKGAVAVWSYYDLPHRDEFVFYHAPLAADPAVFKPSMSVPAYLICTSGLSYLTESVRECFIAAKSLDARVAHIGAKLRDVSNVDYYNNVPDEDIAEVYRKSWYVSGLRRIEGFELPAVEGLFCGARPIMFDRPHYRQWFEDFAIFIPEGPRDEVVCSLERVMSEARPVSGTEILAARERFNWDVIIKGFWNEVLAHI